MVYMKRNLLLLPAVTLFAGLSSMDVFAQNPVQNLKADVSYNSYVNLSWDAPALGEITDVTDDNSSYALWKKVTFPEKYGSIIQIDDYYLASIENDSTTLFMDKLDMNLNVVENLEIEIDGFGDKRNTFGISCMNNVNGDIYALVAASSYRENVFKFNLQEKQSTIEFKVEKYGINDFSYVADLDNGNGGFIELRRDTVYFYDKSGNKLSNVLHYDEIPLDEGQELTLNCASYYNGVYYVIGNKGEKQNYVNIPYIWEFDSDGHLLGEKLNMKELLGYYFAPQHAYIYEDSSNGNVYLVVEVKEYDEAYVCVHYYFEIATSGLIKGYDVFRDDTQLSTDGFAGTTFADTLTVPGQYTYSVRAVYENGLSEFESVDVEIEDPGITNIPENFNAYVVNGNNVFMQWSKPDESENRIMKYYVYRDGKKLGETIASYYVDNEVANGEYTYSVRAVNTMSGLSDETSEIKVNVTNETEMYAPRSLTAVSYIDSENTPCVDLAWKNPLFGKSVTMSYSDMEATGDAGDARGMGIKYPVGTLSHVDGYTLDSVSFIAGCAGRYRIIVYENEEVVSDMTLDSLAVKFDSLNNFALETPVDIDMNNEYFVAVVSRIDSVARVNGLCCITSDDAVFVNENNYTGSFFFKDGYEYYYSNFRKFGTEKGNYNIEAHFSAIDESELYEEGSGFKGYAIYRNGEKLDAIVKDSEEYTDIPGKDGDYTYTVASTWENGEDLHSNAVSRNVTALYGAPDNLVATVDGSDITLNWNAPLSGAPFVKRWDSGKNSGKLGNKAGGTMYMATLFTTEDLKSFPGFSITNVEFFPAESATFTIVVYSGEDLVYSQLVEEEELKVGEFNVIELDSPVLIDATKDLRVGYKVEYSANSRPCGLDETESADGKGNQLSMDGKYWMPATEQGVYNNWNIAFTVQYFNNIEVARIAPFAPASVEAVDAASFPATLNLSAEMTSSAQRSNLSGNTLAGYNVYRNGEKITASPVQDLTFSEVIAEGGDFEYYVGAVYTESEEMFSNRVSVSKTGVGDVVSSAVAVYPNPATTEVHVSCGFDSYVVYDLSGRAVLRSDASGDVIAVGNLSAGQYLLVFAKDNMEYNRKITVVR